VNAVAAEGCVVELWLPKARQQGREFDLRVVTINGQPRHFVLRCANKGPITNLHLGNARGDADTFLRLVPRQGWTALLLGCQRVARAFPDSLYLGIDVCLSPRATEFHIIEVNAFGDLLPRIVCEELNTYEFTVRECLRRLEPTTSDEAEEVTVRDGEEMSEMKADDDRRAESRGTEEALPDAAPVVNVISPVDDVKRPRCEQ